MIIGLPEIRDRRVAAADENQASGNREIYGRGSQARRLSQQSRQFDVRQARLGRATQQITTVILHQTTFSCTDALPSVSQDRIIGNTHRLDRVIAHFVVREHGEIIYTHDVGHILNSVSGRRGIDIEFEGRYGHQSTPRSPRLSPRSIRAGRRLLLYFKKYIPSIEFIHPHGQVQRVGNGKHDSCSGPDVWMNIGEWAATNLGWSCDQTDNGYPNRGISNAQRNLLYDQQIVGW